MKLKKLSLKNTNPSLIYYKIGFYNKIENIFYVYQNKDIILAKKLHPQASIQLSIL